MSNEFEAVQRAVAILEDLIKTTEKNEELEMTEQLKEAQQHLLSLQKDKRVCAVSLKRAMSLVRLFISLISSS